MTAIEQISSYLLRVYSEPLMENVVKGFYKDKRDFVTIGVGFMLGPGKGKGVPASAMNLGYVFTKKGSEYYSKKFGTAFSAGSPVSGEFRRQIITEEYGKAKRIDNQRRKPAVRLVPSHIELDDAAIQTKFLEVIQQKYDAIQKYYGHEHGTLWHTWAANFDDWPLDAQLGILAIAYNGEGHLGKAAVHFRKLREACAASRFDRAAKIALTIHFGDDWPRIQRRRFWQTCFSCADEVLKRGLPKQVLMTPLIRHPVGDFSVPEAPIVAHA